MMNSFWGRAAYGTACACATLLLLKGLHALSGTDYAVTKDGQCYEVSKSDGGPSRKADASKCANIKPR